MVFIVGAASLRTTVSVTITGAGDSKRCYAIINGTKQYSAGTHEVNSGDTITFGVSGSPRFPGLVTIDGTQVLKVPSTSAQTYDWTVPSGNSTIKIVMYYNPEFSPAGQINVTTA